MLRILFWMQIKHIAFGFEIWSTCNILMFFFYYSTYSWIKINCFFILFRKCLKMWGFYLDLNFRWACNYEDETHIGCYIVNINSFNKKIILKLKVKIMKILWIFSDNVVRDLRIKIVNLINTVVCLMVIDRALSENGVDFGGWVLL